MKYLVMIVMLVGSFSILSAQSAAAKAYQKQYAKNIRKSRINNVYIPKNLEEAYQELTQLSDKKSIAKFKNAPEDVVANKLHFGLGRWIATNWNFQNGSRFSHYLKSLGLKNRDDMIQFTIVSFHRHLNNRPLQTEERVKAYDAIIQRKLEERKKRSTTEIITVKKKGK